MQFKIIKLSYARYDLKSPVEKIIQILPNLKDSMNDDEFLMKEIEWLEKNKSIKKSV